MPGNPKIKVVTVCDLRLKSREKCGEKIGESWGTRWGGGDISPKIQIVEIIDMSSDTHDPFDLFAHDADDIGGGSASAILDFEPPPESIDVQLLALDLDGTMLRNSKKVSVATVRMIRRVVRQGIPVVLATARPPRSTREVYNLLGLNTPVINYNGALIQIPGKRRDLYHQPLDQKLAGEIIRLARKVDKQVVVSLEIRDKWYTDHVDESLPTETSRKFSPDFVGPLESFLHVPVTKMMLLAPPERLAAVKNAVAKKFIGQIGIAISDEHLMQVIHPDVDKGAALKIVADHLKVDRENILAIGDAPNDIGMLQYAGMGLAMANGWDSVRDVADAVIPTNNDDGVAYAIRKYILHLPTDI